MQSMRVAGGSALDRTRPLAFSFDGIVHQGYAGDTLASALLANDVRLVARSFKYHRPRGIVGIGAEEPNALVRLGAGAAAEPNARATQVELVAGLAATSQNCWPSLGFDLGAVSDALSPLLPAGFYYKTFKWPPALWLGYERLIRRAAGMGRAPAGPDPDRYETVHAETDLLVVGGGPAGLAAARAAARRGARVVLADENDAFGGRLLLTEEPVDGGPAAGWIDDALAELAASPRVRLMRRATVFGAYEHGLFAVAERCREGAVRERLWKVRAREAVLAAGAIERPLVFPDNDRPGVMLASAVLGYLVRYGVLCGRRAVVFTAHDGAYATAWALRRAGAEVVAVDLRGAIAPAIADEARRLGVELLPGHAIVAVEGRRRVAGVAVAPLAAGGAVRPIEADLVCVSGGWTPSIHLHSHAKGKIAFDAALGAFVPAASPAGMRSVGACNGRLDLAGCIEEGEHAGSDAAAASARAAPSAPPPPLAGEGRGGGTTQARSDPFGPPLPLPPQAGGRRALSRGKCFVDLQNDVTAADIALAAREGYRSVEHLKRYTTLGMGTDQGKTSNMHGLALLGEALGAPPGGLGVTTFRPPYTPVTVGTLAGRAVGALAHPIRRTAAHALHEAAGAAMTNAGLWKRPLHYARPGETAEQAAAREVSGVRGAVGLVDVSTLGKIELRGADAATLLDRLYVNSWRRIAVGRGRYGLMLRDDGMVFDDGVTFRLADDRFLMTTTTVNADAVVEWVDFLLQTQWPELKVFVTPVTEQWFAAAMAGPRARDLLALLAPALDVGNEAFPLMSVREAKVAGIDARILRISFSGELSYEVNVAADYGAALWQAALAAGAGLGIAPYGVDAMGTLRIEKGHVVIGAEADGRTTPDDLGLGALVDQSKEFIGRRSLRLPGVAAGRRRQLVGVAPVDPAAALPVGAQLVLPGTGEGGPPIGHVTSYTRSPTLGRWVALALLEDGRARLGEELVASSPTHGLAVHVRVTAPCFVDPEGARQRG